MKSKVKKITSALLIVCMLVMLIPNSVIALEEDNAAAVPGVSVLTENDIPENLDLQTVLERNHTERLYDQETEMNSVTFKNQDGTATVYLFDEAIKYVDAAGNVKDKSNRLTKVTGGYTNVKNDINVLYPDNIANGVTMTYGEYSVKLVHVPQSNGNQMSANAVAELVSVINKQTPDKMIYDGVYGSNTYVEYIQNFNGFKENIIVESAGGQTSFSYLLYTGGLTPVEEAGTLVLVDGENNEICTLGALYIYDSNGNEGYGEYEVVEIKEGQIYGVTIVADDFFALPDIAYPVTVDPNITCSGNDGFILDTTIYSSCSDYAGALPSVQVGTMETKGIARALIKIDNEASNNVFLNLMAMYQYGAVSSIRLFFKCMSNTSTPMTVNAHLFTKNWGETSVMPDTSNASESAIAEAMSFWNGYNSAVLSSDVIPTRSEPYDVAFELINAFAYWSTNDNKGIMLKASDETHSHVVLGSSENGWNNNPGIEAYRPYISYTINCSYSISFGEMYQIKNSAGTLAISYSDYDSSNMTLVTPNASAENQLFVIRSAGTSGIYEISTVVDGAASDFLLGVTNGNLSVESPSGETYQQWYIAPQSGGGYKIVNVANPTYCLALNGSSVLASSANSNNVWLLSEI